MKFRGRAVKSPLRWWMFWCAFCFVYEENQCNSGRLFSQGPWWTHAPPIEKKIPGQAPVGHPLSKFTDCVSRSSWGIQRKGACVGNGVYRCLQKKSSNAFGFVVDCHLKNVLHGTCAIGDHRPGFFADPTGSTLAVDTRVLVRLFGCEQLLPFLDLLYDSGKNNVRWGLFTVIDRERVGCGEYVIPHRPQVACNVRRWYMASTTR